MRGLWTGFVAGTLALALAVPVAGAQEASPEPAPTPSPSPTGVTSTVTLRASDDLLTYGGRVRLAGKVEPVVPAAEVRIVDRDGNVVASVVPDANGRYETTLKPQRNEALTATYLEASSGTRTIKVRPVLRVKLGRTPLFGKTTISGVVAPATKTKVRVALMNNGRVVKKWSLAASDGSFRKRIRMTRIGKVRAKATYGPAGLGSRTRLSNPRSVSLPLGLATGSHGGAVKRLEWRLRNLGYYIPRADERYGSNTRDAVIAFHKVQRMTRSGSVGAATWRALATPKRPGPRVTRGSHIEIDQTRQVIFVVRKGKVRWMLHTSTGAGGASRDGDWTVNRKLAGYSPGRLYYPSYYDGLRAVHGWPEVPTYPASHGCARVPMWSATWIHDKMPHGTRVLVYH